MKASQIKVGDEYAYQDYTLAKYKRVRIVEVGVRRNVTDGDSWHRRAKLSDKVDGCCVLLPNGTERVVRNAQIVMTWADAEHHIAAQAASEETHRRRLVALESAATALADAMARAGLVFRGCASQVGMVRVLLTTEEADALRDHINMRAP